MCDFTSQDVTAASIQTERGRVREREWESDGDSWETAHSTSLSGPLLLSVSHWSHCWGGPREAVERSKGQHARARERGKMTEQWRGESERERGGGSNILREAHSRKEKGDRRLELLLQRRTRERTHSLLTHTRTRTYTCRQKTLWRHICHSCTHPDADVDRGVPCILTSYEDCTDEDESDEEWENEDVGLPQLRTRAGQWGPAEWGTIGMGWSTVIEHMHLHVCMCMSVCVCVHVWNVCVNTRMPPQRGTS